MSKIKILNLLGGAGILVFLLFISKYLFSSSVDLAHHYALIDNLSKYLTVNEQYENLGAMSLYPNFSHWLAVIWGAFFNSNMVGMSCVSMLSLVVIWFVIAIFILNLPPVVSLLSFLFIFIVGLFSNDLRALYGQEIIGNFFYSQLVGESIAFSVLLLAFFLFEKIKILTPILLFSSLLLAYFHLLPALQILGLSFLIILFDVYTKKKIDYSLLLWFAGGAGLFLFHPSFEAMRLISANNGVLSFPFMSSSDDINYITLFSLFVVSFFMSVYFIFSDKFTLYKSMKLLSFFSLSSSILMLLQTIALFLGYGSEYAVKKYIFTLVSLLTIQICVVIAYHINVFFERKYRIEFCLPHIFVASVFSILMITSGLCVKPNFLLSELVRTEKKLQAIISDYIPNKLKHKAIYLDENNVLGYMFSISILEHPMDFFGMKLLDGTARSNISNSDVSYIISKIKNDGSDVNSNYKGYSIITKDFFIKSLKARYMNIFSDDGLNINQVPESLQKGWNGSESWGVWSAENAASLNMISPINGVFNVFSFFATSWYKDRKVSVKINEIDCGEIIVSTGDAKNYTLNCPVNVKNDLHIVFYIDEWDISPKKLNLSDDARNLGVGLKNIKLY